MKITWTEFKNIVDSERLGIRYLDLNNSYFLKASVIAFDIKCVIKKTDPANIDQTDFENNYKSSSNSGTLRRTRGRGLLIVALTTLLPGERSSAPSGAVSLELEAAEVAALTELVADLLDVVLAR